MSRLWYRRYIRSRHRSGTVSSSRYLASSRYAAYHAAGALLPGRSSTHREITRRHFRYTGSGPHWHRSSLASQGFWLVSQTAVNLYHGEVDDGGRHVIFYDPYLPNGADKAVGIERTKDIKQLFRRSSILSIHCPCTRETRNLVNYDLLSRLPKGAVLVNTARGEIVDLDAVQRCLKEGVLSGAGLDVLPVEPPPEPVHSLIQAYRRREEWLMGRKQHLLHRLAIVEIKH